MAKDVSVRKFRESLFAVTCTKDIEKVKTFAEDCWELQLRSCLKFSESALCRSEQEIRPSSPCVLLCSDVSDWQENYEHSHLIVTGHKQDRTPPGKSMDRG